jgi:peroxiredoxin family protein
MNHRQRIVAVLIFASLALAYGNEWPLHKTYVLGI